jgi:hypothetical protein
MRLFPDSGETYYQEVLRTVGAFLEENDFRDIRIVETEDGLIVQGRTVSPERETTSETYLLTVEDIHAMLQEAYQKRGKMGSDFTKRGKL